MPKDWEVKVSGGIPTLGNQERQSYCCQLGDWDILHCLEAQLETREGIEGRGNKVGSTRWTRQKMSPNTSSDNTTRWPIRGPGRTGGRKAGTKKVEFEEHQKGRGGYLDGTASDKGSVAVLWSKWWTGDGGFFCDSAMHAEIKGF